MAEQAQARQVEHTPGPWTLQLSRTEGYVMQGKFCIAALGDCAAPRDANARLIAAAPELLDALQAMVDHYGPDHSTLQSTPWDRARAAIAKARGQA